MAGSSPNSFGARAELASGGRSLEIFRLDALAPRFDVARLPFSLKVLLENLLRHEDDVTVRGEDIEALAGWDPHGRARPRDRLRPGPDPHAGLHRRPRGRRPGRHARRHGRPWAATRPGSTRRSRPSWSSTTRSWPTSTGCPTPSSATPSSSSSATGSATSSCGGARTPSSNFRVVPPNTGICHQVNLEYLARVVFVDDEPAQAYPDTLVGTDSHTTDGQRPRRARLGRRVASRPRRPCSASRCRCSSPGWSASS